MKNFLSVLYRRILYKIPLKWLLIALAIFGLMFAYSKADDITLYDGLDQDYNSNTENKFIFPNDNNSYVVCITNNSVNSNYLQSYLSTLDGRIYYQNGKKICYYGYYGDFDMITISNANRNIDYNVNAFIVYTSQYTSLQCQTEYSLIPISSVDSNYCTSNNLCPSSDCPIYTGDLTPGVSNIWINDIFHPGAFNVIMNIPEEIDRDYTYTNSGQNMNIDVVGYNVDYDYIDGVVDSQNYKPSSDDLSSIVSQIIPLFVPGLCIILLLYFIFRFVKKIF